MEKLNVTGVKELITADDFMVVAYTDEEDTLYLIIPFSKEEFKELCDYLNSEKIPYKLDESYPLCKDGADSIS